MKILAINPGMISTKVGVFENEELLMHATLNHPFEELCRYPFIMDEFDYRKEKILEELQRQGYTMDFDVVVWGIGETHRKRRLRTERQGDRGYQEPPSAPCLQPRVADRTEHSPRD